MKTKPNGCILTLWGKLDRGKRNPPIVHHSQRFDMISMIIAKLKRENKTPLSVIVANACSYSAIFTSMSNIIKSFWSP
jgi:hypothetical protein